MRPLHKHHEFERPRRGGSRTALSANRPTRTANFRRAEREAEARAAPEVALDVHGAAVRFDEAARYRQSQPGARRVVLLWTGPDRSPRNERSKTRGRSSAAMPSPVSETSTRTSFPFGRRAQGYGAVCRGVAEGVGDEVVEHALEPGRVREHGVYVAYNLSNQAHAALIGLRLEAGDGVGDQVVQRGFFEAELQHPCVYPGELEEVVHEAAQVRELAAG